MIKLLDTLRNKCESVDIDFKSTQYRFARGTKDEKSEILKDILAMANARRGETAYILLGLKEQRPHPALVVGITESIDDASLQQFVYSKVMPKLIFNYEEHLYENKTIGVIVIPKQERPFFLKDNFGPLQKNVVYVRRGSSTVEATPIEICEMKLEDKKQGDARVNLKILSKGNHELAQKYERCFWQFKEKIPDFDVSDLASYNTQNRTNQKRSSYVNKDYYREYGEFMRIRDSNLPIKFVLVNNSSFQISNIKVEIYIDSLASQKVAWLVHNDLPQKPRQIRATILEKIFSNDSVAMPNARPTSNECNISGFKKCEIRVDSLLPGETKETITFAIVPESPGRLQLRLCVLATELSTPIVINRLLEISGVVKLGDISTIKSLSLSKATQDDGAKQN